MEREPQIVFRNMPASPALEAVIRERIDRLEQYHSNIIGCRVVAEVPHRSAEGHKPPLAIAVELDVGGRPRIVAKDSESRREAKNDQAAVVTHVFEAVERQLRDTSAVQKREVKVSGAALETGVIVRLFPDQQYGFVETASGDLYFTRNAVKDGAYDRLSVGTMVSVSRATSEGPMGPQASLITLLDAPRSPS